MDSDVYKMLQDYERPVSEPKQSGSFRYLQGMLEAGENGKLQHSRFGVCFKNVSTLSKQLAWKTT